MVLLPVSASDVQNGSNDNCGTTSSLLNKTSFNCSDVGLNTVILTITDGNGNSGTCSAIVTVEDQVAPNAQCKDATVQLDANGNGSITAADVDNSSNDLCGIANRSFESNHLLLRQSGLQ